MRNVCALTLITCPRLKQTKSKNDILSLSAVFLQTMARHLSLICLWTLSMAFAMMQVKTGFDTHIKTGFDTQAKTGLDTQMKTGFDTQVKTGFVTQVKTGFDTPIFNYILPLFSKVE